MTRTISMWRGVLTLTVLATLAACGGGGGSKGASPNPPNPPQPPAPSRTIGGSVTGLSGSGLVLQNNGGDNLAITSNGGFTFANNVANGGAYAVTAFTQPTNPAQTCTVTNGSGTATANVTSVLVTCVTDDTTTPPPPSRTIGGTVSGLSGSGLVLQNNGGDNLAISGNGAFTFPTAIANGSTYSVTALTQPTGPAQTCTVTNGSGTANANVTSVAVNCVTDSVTPPPSRTIGGTVSGLSGSGLVLQNNGGNNLAVSANGAFTFSTAIANGTAYAVTVLTQPTNPLQTCTVTNGAGTANANVSSVAVNCVTRTFDVRATVTGLTGAGLVLGNNADRLTANSNATFTFTTPVASGARYNVVVESAPDPAQRCTVANGNGVITNAAVEVAVTCSATAPTFAYGINKADGTLTSYVVNADTGQLRTRAVVRTGDSPAVALTYKAGNGNQFSYVLNTGSNNVSAFAVDPRSGELSAVAGSPFATGTLPTLLVSHPTLPVVYVTNETSGTVTAFTINTNTGALTALGTVNTTASPRSFNIDASGRFAYVATSIGMMLHTYAINQTTGALSAVPTVAAIGPSLGGVALERDGKYLYAFNPTGGSIFGFALNSATGVPSALSGSPFTVGANINFLGAHPNGKFIYAKRGPQNQSENNGVAVFTIDAANGALSEIAGSPFDLGANPLQVAVDPTGQRLYVSHLSLSPIQYQVRAYAIDATSGALSAIGSPVSSPQFPEALAIDTTGKFLYTSNAASDVLTAYRIDASNGSLSQLPSSPVSAGNQPGFISVDEDTTALQLSSKFVYTTDASTDNVHAFAIAANGTLTAAGADIPLDDPLGITLDPKGRYAYAIESSSNSIHVYSVAPLTGVLTEVGTPVTTGNGPRFVVIEPSGRYAYVSLETTQQIVRYTIDASTGALSSPTPTALAGEAVNQLLVTPNGRWLLATSGNSTNLHSYRIDASNGDLLDHAVIVVDDATTPTGDPIDALAVDPSGRYLYVTNTTARMLRSYQILPQSGVLSLVDEFSFASVTGSPVGVAADVAGQLLFTADQANNQVNVFQVANGDLTQQSAVSIAQPLAVTTDYSGKFVYVVTASGQLHTLSIDRGTNTLTEVGTAVATGAAVAPGTIVTSTHTE